MKGNQKERKRKGKKKRDPDKKKIKPREGVDSVTVASL